MARRHKLPVVTRYQDRRMMRPGLWGPAVVHGLRDPEIEAWVAGAPQPISVLIRVLMAPGGFDEQADRIRDAGHIWRNIVRRAPSVSAWSDAHLLEWLDAMPALQ